MTTNAQTTTGCGENLARLSLDAALELDRLRRGEDPDRKILANFANCLRQPGGRPGARQSQYLSHSPQTIDAYFRAWRTISKEDQQNLSDLKAGVARLLAEILDERRGWRPHTATEPEKVQQIERFCLALHRALIAEKPARLRAKRFAL